MMLLASRVSGILAGSITSRCASHSAASCCTSARLGAASVRRAGVFTGRPSSRRRNSFSASSTSAR
jgi:hypothetical protein